MSVEGTWYNELGSMMILSITGTSITGTYQTAVGDASGIYQLVGSFDVGGNPSAAGQAIAWVVVWSNQAKGNSHSVTAWSGQYQIIDGVEEIETMWLLTSEMPTNFDWAATQINKDVFTRSAPPPETIVRASKKRMPAHPI
ncbi:MAG: hypothetical protein F6K31_04280 [Symploca sp. SIO2G7]|nr:hypothetical protein [Symploca sp. SIO2G7]